MALGEVLVAERRFFFYGAAPLLYNLGIVIGTVLLVDAIGIFAPAVGAVLGAAMHLGIRLIGITRTTFRPWPRLAAPDARRSASSSACCCPRRAAARSTR